MPTTAIGEAIDNAAMFGQDTDYDSYCIADYDPWSHAEQLGLHIIYRDDLPDAEMVACYSEMHGAIFVRPTLTNSVERCAIAHEIVHHEYADTGTSKFQEDRADRIAASRLIRRARVEELLLDGLDLVQVALALGVTERIMSVFVQRVVRV